MTRGDLPASEPLSRGGAAFSFSGTGFRTGLSNQLRMSPGEAGVGLVKIGTEEFAVWGPGAGDPETMRRCTTVHGIGPLEHLSAAAAILGVRGWVLEAEHPDLPLFDGSARTWAKMLDGLPREPLRAEPLDLPPCTWNGQHHGRLDAQPSAEFRLEVEWSEGPSGPERWEGSLQDLSSLLEARTFVDAGDWWEARRNGLLQGAGPECGRLLAGKAPLPEQALETLRIGGAVPEGRVWTGGAERVPNECAAHKALDLVGDIAIAIGYLPALRIVARDTGHTLHARLGLALRNAHRER